MDLLEAGACVLWPGCEHSGPGTSAEGRESEALGDLMSSTMQSL